MRVSGYRRGHDHHLKLQPVFHHLLHLTPWIVVMRGSMPPEKTCDNLLYEYITPALFIAKYPFLQKNLHLARMQELKCENFTIIIQCSFIAWKAPNHSGRNN